MIDILYGNNNSQIEQFSCGLKIQRWYVEEVFQRMKDRKKTNDVNRRVRIERGRFHKVHYH